MVDVNIKGVLNGIAAVLPTFEAQKSGHILATSSVAGLKVYPGAGVYCGTKWAVKAIMEALRMESAQAGTHIRTTTLYPAAMQSELVAGITNEQVSKGYRELYDTYEIPADRVANAVLFALSQPEDTDISEITIGPTTSLGNSINRTKDGGKHAFFAVFLKGSYDMGNKKLYRHQPSR